jgi:hypothetical protein
VFLPAAAGRAGVLRRLHSDDTRVKTAEDLRGTVERLASFAQIEDPMLPGTHSDPVHICSVPMTYARSLSIVLAGLLLLTGCRTYGNEGYDSGPKTYDAIQQTVTLLEQELGRAESDLRRLESAAASMDTLGALADRYRSYVASHEATLERYREQADRLSGGSAYRSLHRIYGAMVTDRRLLQRQYQRTTRKIWATVRDTTLPRTPRRRASDYMITPVRYPSDDTPTISMAEALRAVEGTPGLQPEEQPDGAE